MDAVMNFNLRQIVVSLASGEIAPATAARMTTRLVHDVGIEPMLKSWMVIDNHDIPRISHQFPQTRQRRFVQALQFSLPGAPNIYYGAELGMSGGPDPENRGPMRWDLATEDNPELRWMRQLVGLRQQNRALNVGDYRPIEAERLLAFERHTDRVLDTVLVFANPGPQPVTERVMVANALLMDGTPLRDLLAAPDAPASARTPAGFGAGFVQVTVPAETVLLLKPAPREQGGYNRYKRVP
jgi:glycosidase